MAKCLSRLHCSVSQSFRWAEVLSKRDSRPRPHPKRGIGYRASCRMGLVNCFAAEIAVYSQLYPTSIAALWPPQILLMCIAGMSKARWLVTSASCLSGLPKIVNFFCVTGREKCESKESKSLGVNREAIVCAMFSIWTEFSAGAGCACCHLNCMRCSDSAC